MRPPRRDDLPIYWTTRGGEFIRLIPGPRGGYVREEECEPRLLALEEFDFASLETSILESYVRAQRKA